MENTAAYQPGSGRKPAALRYGRSRVTNGKLLAGDNRSAWARRAKDVIALHTSDLGGADNVSAAEASIIRRCAVLTVELERLEVKFAQAGAADANDLDLYQRCAGNLRRLLEAIGLQRRPKDIGGLTLGAVLRAGIEEDQRRERERREGGIRETEADE